MAASWACLGTFMVCSGVGQVLFLIPLTCIYYLDMGFLQNPHPDRHGLLPALDFFTPQVTVTIRPMFRPTMGFGEAWLLELGQLGHMGSKCPFCARCYRSARARAVPRAAAGLRRVVDEEGERARGRVLDCDGRGRWAMLCACLPATCPPGCWRPTAAT